MQFYDWNTLKSRTETDGYSRGVASGEKMMLAHVKLEDGAITAPHTHTYEEIIYVVSGRWQIDVAGKRFVLETNQSLVVPPNVEHSSLALEETVAVVCTGYRSEWQENSDYWLHYNKEAHLWAV